MDDNQLEACNALVNNGSFGIHSYMLTDSFRKGADNILSEDDYNAITKKEQDDYVPYYCLNTRGMCYIRKNDVLNSDNIERSDAIGRLHDLKNSYKIILPKTTSQRVWRDSFTMEPGYCYIDDVICIQFNDADSACICDNYLSYLKTRFYRFLVEMATPAGSQHANSSVHCLVPDVCNVINPRTGLTGFESDWTDGDLFALLTLNPMKAAVESGLNGKDALSRAVLTVDDWIHIIKSTKNIDQKGERMLASGEIPVKYELADHINELEDAVNSLVGR